MTASNMGQAYITESRGRLELVRFAFERERWATVVREAQECLELMLKGALRLVGIEGVRSHDVAELLRQQATRFPDWFAAEIGHMASISTEMAGDRGLAFYGDERQQISPQELFDRGNAERALGNAEYVAGLCERLLDTLSRQRD